MAPRQALRKLMRSTTPKSRAKHGKKIAQLIAFFGGTYCITGRRTSTCARVAVCGTSRDVQRWSFGPLGGVSPSMIKKRTDSAAAKCRPSGSDAASRLQSVNQYLEKNFPD